MIRGFGGIGLTAPECHSFTSMVLLKTEYWSHQRSGGMEAWRSLSGDRNWSKSLDYYWLKSPGANDEPKCHRDPY